MDMWMDVDAALAEVPVNIMPLIDDTDFKTRETGVTFDQAGMDLVWNFVTTAGAMTQTAVTPASSGNYLWTNQGDGMYSIQIPASAGATINNDTEGFGWFTGFATGILPWRGPVIGFRAAGLNDLLIDSAFSATRGLTGTALPAVAAEAAGGVYTRGSGAGQINQAANGQVDINLVAWLGTAAATPTVAGVPEVDLTHIDGLATNANLATLNLKQLNIVNSGGTALVASSTGSSGHGISASGNFTGEGITATGGTSGDGIRATGGGGSAAGIYAQGGASGNGMNAVGGATTGFGLSALAQASGLGGIYAGGVGAGAGFTAVGGTTGPGIGAYGGATSGAGIVASASADGNGITATGVGAGEGISATGGATGHGIEAIGGATSGDGIHAVATTLGDGIDAAGAGGGVDIRGNITGNLSGTIGGLTAAALADFFDTNSGTTYGASVAGSVVKEIADNAGGSGDPWATALPGAYGAGTAGQIVGDFLDIEVSSRLAPTVAGRTLDVTATGTAGVDWANVEGQATAVNLSATNIDPDQVVASVTGAVGSLTTNNDKTGYAIGTGGITALSFDVGAIDAAAIAANAIGASEIAAGAITSAKFAAGAIDAAALATDAVNELRDAIFARVYSAAYGAFTFEQITEIIVSACAGVASGFPAGPGLYRNLNNSATVINATMDGVGNRTAVTLTP